VRETGKYDTAFQSRQMSGLGKYRPGSLTSLSGNFLGTNFRCWQTVEYIYCLTGRSIEVPLAEGSNAAQNCPDYLKG